MKKYKYDIAFSLKHEDLDFAKDLFEILNHYKLNIFLYPHNQKELTGKNGISIFSKVFKEDARIIALIHREGYGETHWTRIEKSAIESRFLAEGPEFCLLVKRDKTSPIWYPPYMQYINSQMETKDIADLILYKVQEKGGELEPKTYEEYLIDARTRRDEKNSHYRSLVTKESYDFVMSEFRRSKSLFLPYVQKAIENLHYLNHVSLGFNNDSVFENTLYLGKVYITISFIGSDNGNTSQCFILRFTISEEKKSNTDLIYFTQDYRCNFNPNEIWGWSKVIPVSDDAPLFYPKIMSENSYYELDSQVQSLEELTEYWFTEYIKLVVRIHKV